jgi:hypothetical protein
LVFLLMASERKRPWMQINSMCGYAHNSLLNFVLVNWPAAFSALYMLRYALGRFRKCELVEHRILMDNYVPTL